MKDLDFDELDKAVNSLIANAPVSNNATVSAPKETVLNLSDSFTNQAPVVAVASQPTESVAQTQSQSITRPSTGRFMDVVHPSSNMRPNPIMPDRLSRPSIEPVPVGRPLESPRFSSFNRFPAPKPVQTPVTNNFSTSSDNDNDDDIDQISNDISKAMGSPMNAPMDSPFLPDAKVDKRPLGAFSDDQSSAIKDTPVEMPVNDTTKDDSESSDIMQQLKNNNVAALPDELQGNLLKIEANDMAPEEELAEDQPKPLPVETPAVNNSQPFVAASITQQYTEQPSTGDQKTGSIYDTKSYHKALAPTKKKSGWLWVLWIFLLLVVGAGSGAAVYFLVLPNL